MMTNLNSLCGVSLNPNPKKQTMKVMFLEQDPKLAAKYVPVKMAGQEANKAIELLSAAVRLIRGRPGEIIQPHKNIFNKLVHRIDSYPLVIDEDTIEEAFIPLVADSTDQHLLWVLQSPANVSWVVKYLQELNKLFGLERDLTNIIHAVKNTKFTGNYKTKTPPPWPAVKTYWVPSPEESWQRYLHTKSVEWVDGAPAWWSQEVSDKLAAMKEAK